MSDLILHAPFAGWLAPIEDVPDPVFAERMMGDGFAIDPVEGVLRAPADARVIALPDSGHAVSLALANGAELLLHIGLETVALAGEGFRPRVAVGDTVKRGDVLIEFDLDRVARRAKDMITPIVVASEGATLIVDRPGRRVAAGDPVGTIRTAQAIAPVAMPELVVAKGTLIVTAPFGIHARPAARIGSLLKPYAAQVTFTRAERTADARSTVALLALGAKANDTLNVEANGPDAEAALAALIGFAAERFGDDDSHAPALPVPATGGGITASPGLAIGQVVQLRPQRITPPEYGEAAEIERAALDKALHAVAGEQRGTGTASAIAEAHRALLDDPALRRAADARIDQGFSAAYGWANAIAEAAASIRATGDPLLIERVADLEDLEQQVIAHLLGTPGFAPPAVPPGTILVAADLLPSQFLALDRDRLAGICTAAGGPTAHVAILAASAGVPMVVAAGRSVLGIPDGRTVLLDADAGTIEEEPADARLAAVSARIAERRAIGAAAIQAAHEPCVMADGTRIEIFANLGSVDDAANAVRAGAEGCGLLRTEFLFLDRKTPPDEKEQCALYARIATTLGDRPLIVRTLDIGGDKPVPYLPRATEDNPALGLRGIRLSLARPDLFAVQLRAILRGVPGAQCRIMLPMIVDKGELSAARAMLAEACAIVGRTDLPALGVMIETPAAAMLADTLAAEADFLSIGTNDLTQYTLAADRGNAAVSGMTDALHPAVLRLIAQAATGAARHGRWTGVCGGLASDPAAAPILIGLGVTELSAAPAAIPALKAAVRALDMPACVALAKRACAAASAQEVRAMLAETAR